MKTSFAAATLFVLSSCCAQTYPGVDAVIGVGSLITGDHTDYKVNSSTNVLQGTQIGRSSPQFLAGVAFQLPPRGFSGGTEPWQKQPWHVFVSLKFASGSTNTIVGYVFGISYKVQKYLDLLAGYAQTPFNEASPGFRRAAMLAVEQNPKSYPTFNVPAMNNNKAGAFDGFPLQMQGSGAANANLYPGDPLEPHYRGGVLVGISFALDIKALFTGSGNNGKTGDSGKTPH